MTLEIHSIQFPLPFGMGRVNCYLIQSDDTFILIDTGNPTNRKGLMKGLEEAGCSPGLLKLIILTHGDYDHTGNAAYLRDKFDTRIGMHVDDWGMLEQGNMFANRKSGGILMGKLVALFSGFGKSERCIPDINLEDGDDLSEFGLQGQIISIPGHSKGSIGILLTDEDPKSGSHTVLFCGDLLDNVSTPRLNKIMDDKQAALASLERLKDLGIQTVYPGHGEPFLFDSLSGQI